MRKPTAMSFVKSSATDRNHNRVPNRATMVDGDVGLTSADIHQHAAQFLLVFTQNRFGGSDGFENRVIHVGPLRLTAVTVFCAAVVELVTICTLTSRRVPNMPIGSEMPR